MLLPFAWNGVWLGGGCAQVLRARLSRSGDGLSLVAADGRGVPALSVRSLLLRPVAATP